MKYSSATNYGLHTMAFLYLAPKGESVGVDVLAKVQDLSPTYLSKILTKLVKAGLIESTPGAKGGYRIVKRNGDISFLQVIQAIEGSNQLFHCSLDHDHPHNEGCLIEQAMLRAEEQMVKQLEQTFISDIAEQMKASQKSVDLN